MPNGNACTHTPAPTRIHPHAHSCRAVADELRHLYEFGIITSAAQRSAVRVEKQYDTPVSHYSGDLASADAIKRCVYVCLPVRVSVLMCVSVCQVCVGSPHACPTSFLPSIIYRFIADATFPLVDEIGPRNHGHHLERKVGAYKHIHTHTHTLLFVFATTHTLYTLAYIPAHPQLPLLWLFLDYDSDDFARVLEQASQVAAEYEGGCGCTDV